MSNGEFSLTLNGATYVWRRDFNMLRTVEASFGKSLYQIVVSAGTMMLQDRFTILRIIVKKEDVNDAELQDFLASNYTESFTLILTVLNQMMGIDKAAE